MADDGYIIPPSPKPEKTQAAPHPSELRRATAAIVISSIAALAALCAGVFSYLQWTSGEGARQDSRKAASEQKADVERSRIAAEASAEAAKHLADGMMRSASAAQKTAAASTQSALAAQRAARFSETSFQVSHRAYMTLETAALDSEPTEEQPWRLKMTFKNVGQTPAVSVNARWQFFLLPVGVNLKRLERLLAPPLGNDNIGANLSFLAQAPIEFSATEKRSVIQKERFIAALATVSYEDIFGVLHQSEWCGIWTNGRPLGLSFGFCPTVLFDKPRMD